MMGTGESFHHFQSVSRRFLSNLLLKACKESLVCNKQLNKENLVYNKQLNSPILMTGLQLCRNLLELICRWNTSASRLQTNRKIK